MDMMESAIDTVLQRMRRELLDARRSDGEVERILEALRATLGDAAIGPALAYIAGVTYAGELMAMHNARSPAAQPPQRGGG